MFYKNIKTVFLLIMSVVISAGFFGCVSVGNKENDDTPTDIVDPDDNVGLPKDLFEIDGDVISFGFYPQSLATGEDGQTELTATPYENYGFGVEIVGGGTYRFRNEKIKWRIVESSDSGYTAISEKILDACAFAEIGCTGFENSLIKRKMDEIYDAAFSDTEKRYVTLSIPSAGILGSVNAAAEATDYAIAKGLRMWGSDLEGYERNAAYWLSDEGQFANYFAFVDFNGKTDETGYISNAPYFGVRLIIRIGL